MISEVIEFLQRVGKYEIIIQNKLIEIQQWKALAESTTAILIPDKVQSSSSQQKMAEAVEKYIEIENEINDYIDRLYDAKRDVLSKIEQLKPTEYDVLHKVYIQFKSFQEVADDYDRSKSWVSKEHQKAIESLERLLLNENA
jgi:DNA-directed RNA polymerase specialized sigma subunit